MKQFRWKLLIGVATACLAAALVDRCEGWAEAGAIRAVLRASGGLDVGAVAVDRAGNRLRLDHVVAERSGLRLTVAELDLPAPSTMIWGWIQPAQAKIGIVTAHDIRIEGKEVVVSIPEIEARDASFGSSELAALFNPKDAAPAEARLAKLSFGTLSAPTVTITPRNPPTPADKGGITFHDVLLTGAVAGRIKSVQASRIASNATGGPSVKETLETGRVVIVALDLPLAFKIGGGARVDADAPLRPLFESFSIEAVKLGGPTGAFSIGAIGSKAFQARPLLQPIATLAVIGNLAPADRTDEERKVLAEALADLAASFAAEHFELVDLEGTSQEGDQKTSLNLSSLAFDGWTNLKLHQLSFDNAAVETSQAHVTLGHAAFDGLDQSGALPVLQAQIRTPGLPLTSPQIQRLVPRLDAATLREIHIEAPDKDLKGMSADGRLNVVDFPVLDLKVGHGADGVATDLAAHAQLVFDVAPTTPSPDLQNFVKFGMGHVDLSSDIGLHWDRQAETLQIQPVALVFKDLMSMKAAATVAQVTPELFGLDDAARAAAVQHLKFRTLDLGIVNAGLAEKALPPIAASANTSVPLLKAELIGQASAAIAKALGAGPTTDQLTAAVTAFVNDPKSLDLGLKSDEGLDLQTLAASASPADLLPHVTISAVANH